MLSRVLYRLPYTLPLSTRSLSHPTSLIVNHPPPQITQYNQQLFNNQRWHGFSRFPTCANLHTVYDSPIRYLMRPVIGEMQITKPGCNLPRNFTGRWFTTGEFDTVVQINSTHIYFKTTLDQFTFKVRVWPCVRVSTVYAAGRVPVRLCRYTGGACACMLVYTCGCM